MDPAPSRHYRPPETTTAPVHAGRPSLAGDTRRFGMKDRRTETDQRDRHQNQRKRCSPREQQQPAKRERHARSPVTRAAAAVGVVSDHRLQQRSDGLASQRDQPDLPEIEPVGSLQHRIERRNQRLHHVVQKVTEADCREHAEGGTLHRGLRLCGGRQHLPSVGCESKGTILPACAIKSRTMSSAFEALPARVSGLPCGSCCRPEKLRLRVSSRVSTRSQIATICFSRSKLMAASPGIGEGSMSGRVEIVEAAIKWFKPYLTGKDPGGIEDHWNRAYYEFSRYRDGTVLMTALAAVDLALWDIEGKRLGLPVWRLAGASEARPMRAYYSHWSQELNPRTPERLAELAAKTRAEGWTCVKWVLPKGGTEAERLRRLVAEVEAVRKGGGPDLDIGLEMWETFSVRSALEFARAVAPYRPLFIEEPTWREMPQVLGDIAAKSPVPLAGGEGLTSRYEFRHLLDAKGAQILQPDVIHCGGITEIRKIASMAEVYGAEMSPHMYYGPVAHVASLHSMASVRNFLMQEWDTGMQQRFVDVCRGNVPGCPEGLRHAE